MSKLYIANAGVAVDKSFPSKQEAGKMVNAYEIPCSGTIDGVQSPFTIKIYGVGSNEKIKSGMTVVGVLNAQYGTYDVKKGDNPDLFKSAGGGPFGGRSGGFEQRKFINYELEAVKLAVEVVKAASVQVVIAGEVTAEDIAEKAVAIARNTFVPYLRSVSQRHDDVAKADNTKHLQGQAIRQIIQNNGLIDMVRGAKLTNGQLAAEYEASGGDANKFITQIRAKFASFDSKPAPDAPAEFDDDIPF
jgi:hypothetical protein